jgi:hypothetical protein
MITSSYVIYELEKAKYQVSEVYLQIQSMIAINTDHFNRIPNIFIEFIRHATMNYGNS